MAETNPMHDQAPHIRTIVANFLPASKAGTWSVTVVPHGVRVSVQDEYDFAIAQRHLTNAGYLCTTYRARNTVSFGLVVTGWDGARLQDLARSLRRRVRELEQQLDECPARTIEFYEQFRLFDGRERHEAIAMTYDRVREAQ